MKIDSKQPLHLTYCTNIHPANGWSQVLTNLKRFTIPLKNRLSPDQPFGIGLRLSNLESRQLLQGKRLENFKRFLAKNGLYVFTINGFPYGQFYKKKIKTKVFAPDWQSSKRLNYTLRLVKILAYLLPVWVEGSISTSPLSYKAWVNIQDKVLWQKLAKNLHKVVSALIFVKQTTGKLIHLDIEPEPDGLLENSQEIIDFYQKWLLKVSPTPSKKLIRRKALLIPSEISLAFEPGMKAESSEDDPNPGHKGGKDVILEHIRVCLDTCHMAVEYEDPIYMINRLNSVGIKIGKIQISSALKISFPKVKSQQKKLKKLLEGFADPIYLHQVIQKKSDGSFQRFPDLKDALDNINQSQSRQWRIHFHVPIFLKNLGYFSSTQNETRKILSLVKTKQFCNHLEIETYTWDVLPANFKTDLQSSIEREYNWVLKHL